MAWSLRRATAMPLRAERLAHANDESGRKAAGDTLARVQPAYPRRVLSPHSAARTRLGGPA